MLTGNYTAMRLLSTFVLLAMLFTVPADSQQVEFKNPSDLSKPSGYTHVVIVNRGKLIFISGQVGMDKDGKISSNFDEQAQQAFSNIQSALSAAGAKPTDLVKLNYYVVGLTHEKLLAIRSGSRQGYRYETPARKHSCWRTVPLPRRCSARNRSGSGHSLKAISPTGSASCFNMLVEKCSSCPCIQLFLWPPCCHRS